MLELKFQGDKVTSYKIKARVLKNMSLSGILGMNFLLRNYTKIDLAEGTISLDNKHYELNLELTNNELDGEIFKKTHINANVNSETKVKNMIKEYKFNNKKLVKLKM
ncbi:hypothetical protein EQH57_0240 [Dictyocoela roeselum]|nr:hypothetical protein EQH57_0240 [Dictyocoela roeselum]